MLHEIESGLNSHASESVSNTTGAEEGNWEITYSGGGFSLDQKGIQYATLHSWSQLYGIPHTSLLREIEGKELPKFAWFDASNRPTQELYSEKDIVDICLKLYKQAKLPELDARQVCMIDGAEFITRQWFVNMHGEITWPRVDRCALELEHKQGIRMAKYRPDVWVPQFLRVYRLSAFQHLLWMTSLDLPVLTNLTGDRGQRIGTIPLWAEYLQMSDGWLRTYMTGAEPAGQVFVANKRIQSVFSEPEVVWVVQGIVAKSVRNIVIQSLDDWLALPVAGKTDANGVEVWADMRENSTDLVDTATGWEKVFWTSKWVIDQLIKARKLSAIIGRSWTRVVQLYTRWAIADIFATKKPYPTKRKKSRRKAPVRIQ